jgi:hypothetical protein
VFEFGRDEEAFACLLLFMLVYTIYVFLLVDAQKQKGSDKGFK